MIVVSLQMFSVLNSDDASAPALDTQPQGDEEGELGVGAGGGVGAAVDSHATRACVALSSPVSTHGPPPVALGAARHVRFHKDGTRGCLS